MKAEIIDRDLRCRMAALRQLRRSEDTRHQEALDSLAAGLRKIQADCPHHETTFYGDLAGGNGSRTVCDLCGAEVKE